MFFKLVIITTGTQEKLETTKSDTAEILIHVYSKLILPLNRIYGLPNCVLNRVTINTKYRCKDCNS